MMDTMVSAAWRMMTIAALALLPVETAPAGKPLPVQSDDNASGCMRLEANGRLRNMCNETMDVWFCVQNPQQTQNVFDNSNAFRCPSGGLIAVSPGNTSANILYGEIMWFACSTRHRGTSAAKFDMSRGAFMGRCR